MASIYQINKGVSKPIVFKGLKGQYIAYLAVGLVLLLIGFAVLYISGASLFVVLPIIVLLGTTLFVATFRLSHRFGEHGLMKYLARKGLPKSIKFRSRRVFTTLRTMNNYEKYPNHGRS
jgi:cell division protein FtsW (lipid II flippase)